MVSRRVTSKGDILFLFAHGAGAPTSHPWMKNWARLLRSAGKVRCFDYPYMLESRRRPDRLPVLVCAHRKALAKARRLHAGPIVLIGKSMGSRIGCHVALEEEVKAVICFGYPLCGMGDRSKMRDQVLLELTTPILFIQGTRDPLCPLDLLDSVRKQMKIPTRLEVVDGGDHSLSVAKRRLKARAESQKDVDERVLRSIRAFVRHPTTQKGTQ